MLPVTEAPASEGIPSARLRGVPAQVPAFAAQAGRRASVERPLYKHVLASCQTLHCAVHPVCTRLAELRTGPELCLREP